MSLAFHIIFAAIGIGMPVLMAIAEGLYLSPKKPVYLDLSKRWAKGTAILFAVGFVRHCAFVRTRSALARFHGLCRFDYWNAIFP